MKGHRAEVALFDAALHRPGTRAARGLCADCHRRPKASVFTSKGTRTRSYALCRIHFGDFMLRGLPIDIVENEDSGDDPTSAANPSDTGDVVVCPAYGEHPATLGWVPDVEVWFGRCAACGRPVPLDEDGLTTLHSW